MISGENVLRVRYMTDWSEVWGGNVQCQLYQVAHWRGGGGVTGDMWGHDTLSSDFTVYTLSPSNNLVTHTGPQQDNQWKIPFIIFPNNLDILWIHLQTKQMGWTLFSFLNDQSSKNTLTASHRDAEEIINMYIKNNWNQFQIQIYNLVFNYKLWLKYTIYVSKSSNSRFLGVNKQKPENGMVL